MHGSKWPINSARIVWIRSQISYGQSRSLPCQSEKSGLRDGGIERRNARQSAGAAALPPLLLLPPLGEKTGASAYTPSVVCASIQANNTHTCTASGGMPGIFVCFYDQRPVSCVAPACMSIREHWTRGQARGRRGNRQLSFALLGPHRGFLDLTECAHVHEFIAHQRRAAFARAPCRSLGAPPLGAQQRLPSTKRGSRQWRR